MVKARKSTQRIHTIVLWALVCVMIVMAAGSVMENLFIFMLTGYIVGTDYAVPAWAMFCMYSGAALIIGLRFASDKERESYYVKKLRTNGRLPRRRYSSI